MKKLLVFLSVMFICNVYANTETINWYDETGQTYDTTTCQTGGDINLPSTTPTKRGYDFAGWVPVYDFSMLDYMVNGSDYISNETSKTWTVNFSYGDISGIAICYSATDRTLLDEDSAGERRYCWCKATKYQPIGENVVYEPISSPGAALSIDLGSAVQCFSYCAMHCGNYVKVRHNLRMALFGAQ